MSTIERDPELETLDNLLTECSNGRGGVALITGAVGSGKTELLNTFARRVSAAGVTVLSAMASPAECAIPFGVADQLSHNVTLSSDDVMEVQEIIQDGVLLAGIASADPERIHPQHARVLAKLHAALMRLAGMGPLLVTVDDLQHADRMSLHFLRYLARRITNKPVLLVLNLLSGATPAYPLFQMEILSQPNTRRIRLEPLSEPGIARILEERLGVAEANRLSAMYERLSGGNPLLVNALLEDRLGGADSTAMPPPAQAYRHAVVTCLQRSDELTAQVARGLAALDLSRATRLVGRLLSLEHEAVQRCKHVLRLTGLLDQTGFRHPETRAAVLDSLAPDRRSALHLQVARLLFSEGAAAAEVAKHLLAADDAGETWAPGLLLEASAQALHEDRTDLAARYARLARSGTLNEEERVAVTFMLAQVDGRVNPVASVRHFSSLLDALTEGQLHFDQAIDLVKHLLWHGQLEQAEEALRYVARIRKDADATEPPEWEAFRLWLGCTYPALARNVSDALDPQGADAPPRHTADPHVQAAWLLNGVLRGRLSQLDIAAVQEHLQPLRLSETTYEPLAMTLTALVYADRHETAAAWGELLLKDARDREVPSWKATLSSITAEAAMRCGDPEVAEDHARATLRWGLGVEHATASLLLALVARGALEEAGRLLGRPVRNSAPHTPADLYYRHARGHYYLAINRPLAALAEFETCGRSARSWEMDLPSFVPWRSDTAQALVALGREKEAGDLVNEQLSLLTSAQGRTRALTLRVLAGASAPENRVPLLLEALECLRDDPDRVERCRVLGLLGHAYHAQGDPTEGRRWIRQARDLARECKADGLLTALNLVGEPERETVQDRDGAVGIEDLSKAEQRVALLVSRGHTNSEIAGKLFITVSTVEQHLTRIYRKLGIKHRSGLRSMYEGVVAPC